MTNWTPDDRLRLREFLRANPTFLRYLYRHKPKIEGTSLESRAVTGSEQSGWTNCMELIEELAVDPSPTSENPNFIENEA